MGIPLLKIENVSKNFGGLRALSDINFEIGRDEMVGLIGPNGPEISLIRIITSVLKPPVVPSGSRGRDITKLSISAITNMGIASTAQIVAPFRRLPVISNAMVSCLCPRIRRYRRLGQDCGT